MGDARSALVTLSLAAVLALMPAAGAHCQESRDGRYWPFARHSPWNMPIGAGARYAEVSGLGALAAGINHDGHWTVSVVVASPRDPEVRLLVSRYSIWGFLTGGGRSCGNDNDVEKRLAADTQDRPIFEANPWSTLARSGDQWALPAFYHRASQDYRPSLRVPRGACPSPDSDALMAVVQPDGWVLDTYGTIVLANGTIVASEVASYIDTRGDGTAWWNGRRASSLPSFAGLIRIGELASGRIPHALAAVISPTILTRAAVWPASTFDRNANYTGTLPMGALLAIPANVGLDRLPLSGPGRVLAQTLQNYGVYIVDRGGVGGITFQAELGNSEIHWPERDHDLSLIVPMLRQVINNSPFQPGGGGIPRAPLAPPLKN